MSKLSHIAAAILPLVIACHDGSSPIDNSCAASTECTVAPAPTCVDPQTLRVFAEDGVCSAADLCEFEPTDIDCDTLGCCTDGCCEVIPSNAGDLGALEETGLVIGAPTGTFDTSLDCHASSALGSCELKDSVCVCRMDRLTIADLTVVGAPALAILAFDSVTVEGTLSVGASGSIDGPGSSFRYESPTTSLTGGAGGSHSTSGGNNSAAAYGTDEIVPLLGGMSGQDSCNSRAGGGGGGALQITAGRALVVNGRIDAGGGGGRPGVGGPGTCLGGAGGGSGGAVLLEAPVVQVDGEVVANGGGGGGGGNNEGVSGVAGSDSDAATKAAAGGAATDVVCNIGGARATGGDGGAGSVANESGSSGQAQGSVNCITGTFRIGGGGGGGGGGRFRVNSETGCLCTGTFSPAPIFGPITSR